jgi:hypothetical protein
MTEEKNQCLLITTDFKHSVKDIMEDNIFNAWEKIRVCLEVRSIKGIMIVKIHVRRSYNIHIPHNRINMYMLSEGISRDEERKKKRRKWVRYERKHSMSAGHIDWHEDSKDGIKVCAILDDSSRRS